MTAYCNVEVNGVTIEDSVNRLTKAIDKATSLQSLSKYKSTLKPRFYDYLNKNASKGDVPLDIEDIFSFDIIDNQLAITNSNSYLTYLYEYGYDDDDDIITPRFFMRPAIKQISEDLKNLLLEEVNTQYKIIAPQYVNERWRY